MDPKDYVKNVLVTEARDMAPLQERFSQVRSIRLLHGAIGLASELAEIRAMAMEDEIDKVNLKEEMGDVCWYMGIMTDELKLNPDQVFCRTPLTTESDGSDEEKQDGLNFGVDVMTIIIGEMIDLLKKNLMYGKPLDEEAVAKKLYALGCSVEETLNIFGISSYGARARNIEKLRARYGEKFTEAAALERNLTAEREILEKKD